MDQKIEALELNRDLVLREYLALERTRMANHRTLLSYLRTGLYFLVAGSTLGQLMDTTFWKYLDLPFIGVGLVLAIVGIFMYLRNRRALIQSSKQVGRVHDEFVASIIGTK